MLKLHVTVIDDDPVALSSVCALLRVFDYQVSSFESAEDFLQAEDCSSTQCFLIDVQLPGMSGWELQNALKQRGCSTPILLISGNADAELVREATRDGATAVLEKPIAPAALIDQIQQAMSEPQRSRTA